MKTYTCYWNQSVGEEEYKHQFAKLKYEKNIELNKILVIMWKFEQFLQCDM